MLSSKTWQLSRVQRAGDQPPPRLEGRAIDSLTSRAEPFTLRRSYQQMKLYFSGVYRISIYRSSTPFLLLTWRRVSGATFRSPVVPSCCQPEVLIRRADAPQPVGRALPAIAILDNSLVVFGGTKNNATSIWCCYSSLPDQCSL